MANTDSLPQTLIISREGFADQTEGPFENYAEARARMVSLLEQHPADALSFSTSID